MSLGEEKSLVKELAGLEQALRLATQLDGMYAAKQKLQASLRKVQADLKRDQRALDAARNGVGGGGGGGGDGGRRRVALAHNLDQRRRLGAVAGNLRVELQFAGTADEARRHLHKQPPTTSTAMARHVARRAWSSHAAHTHTHIHTYIRSYEPNKHCQQTCKT